MPKIYDISLTIHPGMIVWPGDPNVQLERVSKMEDGADCNVSHLSFGVHTGTHVDAPYHFVADGSTVEALPLDVLVGPAQVVQLPDKVTLIDARVLADAGIAEGVERLLLKTSNRVFWEEAREGFQKDFVAISEDGARYLVDRGVKLVGIDYLSVAPFDAGVPTHTVLLKAKVVALEGLDLGQVQPGWYELVCLPLKLAGSDGAPTRAILLER
jgi:arylformamidase